MKITLNWLKKYLKTNLDAYEICNKLSLLGFESEVLKDYNKIYDGFKIGKILACEKIHNSNKLSVCRVQIGSVEKIIVCGASNVRARLNVIVATEGAIVPNGNFRIQKTTIRGVESDGMICSAEELLLPKFVCDLYAENGYENIIELKVEDRSGENMVDLLHFNDVLIDIQILPNRRYDASSVRTIAKELSVAKCGEYIESQDTKEYKFKNKENKVKIHYHNKDIGKYFTFIKLIKTRQTDYQKFEEILRFMFLTESLNENEIVNISNYVMIDYGHPNHIYDLTKIKDSEIFITQTKKQANFLALNKVDYFLKEGAHVICDSEKILSLPGVIGGFSSSIDKDTKEILVEVADLNPNIIRDTSSKYYIISEASQRFQSNHGYFFQQDDSIIKEAVNRIIYLLENILGFEFQEFHFNKIDMNLKKNEEILLNIKEANEIMGLNLKKEDVIDILSPLNIKLVSDFVIENDSEIIVLSAPQKRYGELLTKYDIIEEVVRIYGINDVASNKLSFIKDEYSKYQAIQNTQILNEKIISNNLTIRGMSQIITFPFVSNEQVEQMNIKVENCVSLKSPINTNQNLLRNSLTISLIKVITNNLNRSIKNMSFFEIGTIFEALNEEKEILERKSFGGIRLGYINENNIHNDQRTYDFYDIRDDLISCICALKNERFDENSHYNYTISNENIPEYYHPYKSVSIYDKETNQHIGFCGALHPKITKELDINQDLFMFEGVLDGFNISLINKNEFSNVTVNFNKQNLQKKIHPSSIYQESIRDFSFLFKKDIKSIEVFFELKKIKKEYSLIKDIKIFDSFIKNKTDDDFKKSIGIRLFLQKQDGNLTSEEINKVSSSVIDCCGFIGGELLSK